MIHIRLSNVQEVPGSAMHRGDWGWVEVGAICGIYYHACISLCRNACKNLWGKDLKDLVIERGKNGKTYSMP